VPNFVRRHLDRELKITTNTCFCIVLQTFIQDNWNSLIIRFYW